jgi:hypothetical protein
MKRWAGLIIVMGLLAFQSVPVQAAPGPDLPKISVSTTQVTFGSIDFGETLTKTVTLRNKGKAELVISSIDMEGAHPLDFSATHECVTIPAGGACPITVTFNPISVGRRNGILSISSNAAPELPIQVKLTGTATTVEFAVADTTARETSFSAAFDGTNFLVGIQGNAIEDVISNTSVTAQRVSRFGARVGERIEMGETGGVPVVAFDGTNHLLIWSQGASPSGFLHGRFISPSGELVGSTFEVGSGTDIKSYTSLFDGANYFIVWENDTTPGVSDTSDLYGQFVTPAGVLLGSPIAVSTAPHGQRGPGLAFDGSNILVAWADGRNQGAYESDVYGQFITKSEESVAGSLSGSNFAITTSLLPKNNPVNAAFDGMNYFVVYAEGTTLPDKCPSKGCAWKMSGQLVTAEGVPAGARIPIGNATSEFDRLFPSLVFNGEFFLITWTNGYGAKSVHVRGRFINGSAGENPGLSLSPVFLVDSLSGSGNQSEIPAGSETLSATPVFDGANYFWIINRGKPGKKPQDFDAYTFVDVYTITGPGPSRVEP